MEEDTSQRLLDTAEALFAEHGFAETSLRAWRGGWRKPRESQGAVLDSENSSASSRWRPKTNSKILIDND